MKIDKPSKPLPTSVGESTSRNPASKANARSDSRPSTASPETSVHLGSTTAQLRSMESSIAGTPLVDTQKVAEIKQAISEGKFQVNAGVVADRLINTVKDLVAASKH